MDYIIWQLAALVILVVGIGLIGVLLSPKGRIETRREETGMQKKLYLVPLDDISRELVDYLGTKILGRFKFKINSGMIAKLPEESYNPERGGFFSSIILNKLQFLKASDDEYIVAVTDEDLFTPGTDYIISDSDRLGGVAIISTHRLRPEFYGLPQDNSTLRSRALKKLIYEIGHLLGLSNCEAKNCVMYSSKTIADMDSQSDRFCRRCRLELSIPIKVPKL